MKSSQDIYKEVKQSAWSTFVFRVTPSTEVGYGRLNCECPTFGKFIEAYTADIDDAQADGYDRNAEDHEQLESKIHRERKRVKLQKDQEWRKSQDALWMESMVDRPQTQFLYQIPSIQTQTVSFGGLKKFRETLLHQAQTMAKTFGYKQPVFSGSPAGILQDLVKTIPHGLSNNLDPFVWEHYHLPKYESLCVYWHYLPMDHFVDIACGNAPGETFNGSVTQTCSKKLAQVQSDWRQQLALATFLCMNNNFVLAQLASFAELLQATYPLQLVYINDLGELRHAVNLEYCRMLFMTKTTTKSFEYPMNVQQAGYKHDATFDCYDDVTIEQEIKTENASAILNPKWFDFISSGGGSKRHDFHCDLCPWQKSKKVSFVSLQEYITAMWKHACDEHGPIGANHAYGQTPNWIDSYIWTDANTTLLTTIFNELGSDQCGHNEQGTWKNMPVHARFFGKVSQDL